jgi:hypothetical protein
VRLVGGGPSIGVVEELNYPTVKRQKVTAATAVRHQNDEGEATLVKRHQL